MTSDKGVAGDAFDERLAKARDSMLVQGEQITAQVEGDQGQGIILTDSRVIVIKVGITATGEPNGRVTGSFPLSEITAVNVRKGPLGAVIQICASGPAAAPPGAPPDNVVVFTGSQRMKKCESIAARIEQALGKPAARMEAPREQSQTAIPEFPTDVEDAPAAAEAAADELRPDPVEQLPAAEAQPEPEAVPEKKTGRGGRKAISLADEMFAELSGQDVPAPPVELAPPPAPEPAREQVSTPEPVLQSAATEEAPAEPDEAAQHFGPNPNLPKPTVRTHGHGRALVLLGGLMAAVMVGIAVTAPLRAPKRAETTVVSAAQLTMNPSLIRKQQAAVRDYKTRVIELLAPSNQAALAVESALQRGDRKAMAQALQSAPTDRAWRSVSSVAAPAGLAGAKDSLVSGLFIRRNALSTLSIELASSGNVGVKEALSRLADSRSLIDKGMAAIDAMQAEMDKRASRCSTPAGKTPSGTHKM